MLYLFPLWNLPWVFLFLEVNYCILQQTFHQPFSFPAFHLYTSMEIFLEMTLLQYLIQIRGIIGDCRREKEILWSQKFFTSYLIIFFWQLIRNTCRNLRQILKKQVLLKRTIKLMKDLSQSWNSAALNLPQNMPDSSAGTILCWLQSLGFFFCFQSLEWLLEF